MRVLVIEAGVPVTSAYLLVIDPGKLVKTLPVQTVAVESGTRFTLLKLLS